MRIDLRVRAFEQHDPRLGRHAVHDPRSRQYEHVPRQLGQTVSGDRAWCWRLYEPSPVPAQQVGCCTGVDQCVRADAAGNRVAGVVLGMKDALAIYTRATVLDDVVFKGQYPQVDTGSSSLFAAKAAKEMGLIDSYEWIFAGPDAVIAALKSKPVGVGTRWDNDMFNPAPRTFEIKPGGGTAGGHQWTVIGYEPQTRMFIGKCWWGPKFGYGGRFRISYTNLGDLLADDGDAQVTYRRQAGAP
jgi:hypothetical protein